MSEQALPLRKLGERVLAKGGDLPLAMLLEHLVPARALRELARKLGLSPKGGFRLDRAPARVLAPLLAELRDSKQLDEVLTLLLPGPVPVPEPEVDPAIAADSTALLALREAELARLREQLERAREGAARARDREAELVRRLDHAERDATVQRKRADTDPRTSPSPGAGRVEADRELQRRARDLEQEREGFLAADEALRRQLAHNQSRLRELEETVAELEALVPKGRRKQKATPPPTVVEERRFRLPHFLPSFYKSLVGKDRRSIERAFQAILLFSTEGHAYPGLEVKQLGGQDTWSFRASLGLRVYFRPLTDGDIELLELADREEQHTTLRRLKDK